MDRDHKTDLDALRTVTTHLSELLATIAHEHWTLPTPCTDWDLRALVDHVTGGNWFTLLILSGSTAEDAIALAMDRFAGGNAAAEQAVASTLDQLTAFQSPNVLDRTWHHAAGDLTGSQILQLRLHDLILHTWDIDHCLDRQAEVPDDLARWGLAELRSSASLAASHFGAEALRHSSSDRESVDYLAAFGRTP